MITQYMSSFFFASRTLSISVLMTVLFLSACSGGSSTPETPRSTGNIVINEVAAVNAIHLDEDGESSDWVELYNPTNRTINLEGWSLSDNPNKPDKWTFPKVVLEPQSYLVVWASDKNRAGKELHTNFKISNDGETLVLSDSSGEEISRYDVKGTPTGYSEGVNSDGDPGYFLVATPGKENGADWYRGIVNSQVAFDSPGGQNASGLVTLSGAQVNEEIRYTLDGRVPASNSHLYTGPIEIKNNTVIRARIFRTGYIASPTASRTFLPGATHDLPIVALVTNPDHFFDETNGIYVFGKKYEREAPHYGANFWQDWERDIHFSFYEPDGSLGVSLDAGVKIFGGWSRSNAQRSLSIFARSRYGQNRIEYPLFQNVPYDEFKSLVLRNSGNDWLHTMFRDAALTSLMDDTDMEYTAYRPVAVYLNGEYWGLYNMREKVNEDFLASRHDVDADDVDMLEGNADIVEGTNEEYLALLDYMKQGSLADAERYAYVSEQVDIQNFIDYQVAEIYFNNLDWPGNNIKYWKSPTTRWRWILYDTDFSFGLYGDREYRDNMLAMATDPRQTEWPNPAWSTFMLRALLENPEFKQRFINSFADALNGRFQAHRVISRIDEYAAVIESEIPRQFERWSTGPFVKTIRDWRSSVSQMRNFASLRPEYVYQHLSEYFHLSDPLSLVVENNNLNGGFVHLNTLSVTHSPWVGQYFPSVPVTLKAVAKPGYVFSHWEGDLESDQVEITVTLEAPMTLKPVFIQQ